KSGYESNHDGENDLRFSGYIDRLIFHMDAALFLGGEQTDNDRLDNGYEGHIRVGHHGNGPDVIGSQHLRYQNGSGAVGRADDTDGCGVLKVKAKEYGNQDSCKNTELSGGAEQEQLGVGKKR